jgi:hypothetical protein
MAKMTTLYMHFDHASKQLNEIISQDIYQLKNGTLQEFENNVCNADEDPQWVGGSADAWHDDLNAWIRDFKQYLTDLLKAVNRVDLEIAEWVDRDVSYHYTPESFEIASAGSIGDFLIPKGSYTPSETKLGFSWSLKDALGSNAPWQSRLPPESNTYQGLFGLFWKDETKVDDWDAGFYAGWTKGDKGKGSKLGLGIFGSYSLFDKSWLTSIAGFPIGFSYHLLKVEGKAGAGGKGSADLGGGELNFAGLIKIGVDYGLGGGADEGGAKLGPVDISVDLPEIIKAIQDGKLEQPTEPDSW